MFFLDNTCHLDSHKNQASLRPSFHTTKVSWFWLQFNQYFRDCWLSTILEIFSLIFCRSYTKNKLISILKKGLISVQKIGLRRRNFSLGISVFDDQPTQQNRISRVKIWIIKTQNNSTNLFSPRLLKKYFKTKIHLMTNSFFFFLVNQYWVWSSGRWFVLLFYPFESFSHQP